MRRHAVFHVQRNSSDGFHRRKKHYQPDHGDWRADQRDRLRHPDFDLFNYGNLCVRHDYDRRGSTDRISEVLDEVPEMQDPADAVTEVPNGDIDFEHVSFSYGGRMETSP